jgi:hypothetical protein
MNAISQFIVDLSWGLTFGALIAVGVVIAKAAGWVLAALALVGLGWWGWRRWQRR